MAETGLDYTHIFAKDLPAGATRWEGFPKYNFIGGHTNPDEIPIEGLIEASARVLRQDGRSLATYNMDSGPLGYAGLRDFMVEKLAHYRRIRASSNEIMITSGSNPGIDLINDVLLQPGDTVLTEIFTYQGFINRLKPRKVNVIGVSLDEDGMRMDELSDTLEHLRQKGITPKYIYTIPTLQNPTGSVMSMERRHTILRLSQEYGVPIFEDECYTDLLWDGELPDAIRALDPANLVIHIGSFSKNLAPSIRLGYIVAPWEVMSQLLTQKHDSGTGALGQMIVADFFQNHYVEHLDNLRASLQTKLKALTAALDAHFGDFIEYKVPRGGMFLWIKFPDHVDTKKLEEPARAAGIAFNAGPDWAADPEAARPYLRLCFALPSEELISEGVAKLAQVFREELGNFS